MKCFIQKCTKVASLNLAGLLLIFSVHGDNDVVVPCDDNTKLLKHANPDARFAGGRVAGMEAGLEEGFRRPPVECGPWVYWRWKGEDTHLITKPCITDELEAMREQGLGGVVLDTIGGGQQPNAALYMSKAWLELIAHAHREANRLGLGFYIHNCDGWATSGGPWITPENAMKRYTFSKTSVKGPAVFDAKLPQPDAALQSKHPDAGPNEKSVQEFYRDVAVLAYDRSKPATVPAGVVNLTGKMSADGHLRWDVPAGDWTILRFGWAITGSKNAVASPSGSGLECDKLGARGIDAHIEGLAPILDILADTPKGIKSLIGVDSWEAGGHSWTQSLPEEFKAAKGYDMLPWLPVLAGDHLSPHAPRFLQDFNDLIQELVRKNFMGRFTEKMHQRGLLTQCESVPECADIPCSEYWAESPSERIHGPKADFFQADPRRSIAATSSIGMGSVGRGWGKNVMAAESFTSRCQNWERTPYALKSGLDWSFCSGINKTVFHLYAIQPDTQRKPHYMEHGTAVNRNLTWWNQAHAWFDYIARSQFMLRRGTHVSDICFIGDQTPWLKDGKIPKDFPVAYRFDLAPWHRLVHEMTVKNGEAVFPEGAAYRLVVLPDRGDMRPAEIRKVQELLEAGAVVLARRKPLAACGLTGFPEADEQVRLLAGTLWGTNPPAQGERLIGKGRLLWGYTPEEALRLINWTPDFKCTLEKPNTAGVDWVHRRDGAADIYFVVNRANEPVRLDAGFRVVGKRPELWDPDSTEIKPAEPYTVKEGQTFVSLRLEPYESVFVVFREPGTPSPVVAKAKKPTEKMEIGGAWDLRFLDGMGAPEKVRFEALVSWSSRPEQDIKYYSGRVTYTKTITVPEPLLAAGTPVLDLGDVCDLVDVKVNGTLVRTLWKPPYRVSLKGVLKPGENQLEITVANTWLNRFIGDFIQHGRWGVKAEKGPRYTHGGHATQDYNENTPPLASGLMGPVFLLFEDSNPLVSNYGAALIAETLLLAWGDKPLDDDLAFHRIKN